ncbi:MAG: ABC transporter substrate-binding protein [Chloroflexota bacterium]
MSRLFRTTLITLILMLLSACQPAATSEGDTNTEPATTGEETTTEPAVSADDTATETVASANDTRTVTDARGQEITVPANPERVVVLSEQDLDAALALDASVVGTVNGRGQQTPPLYLGKQVEGITSVGSLAEPSLEAIVGLEPDVILIGGIFPAIEGLLPQLAEIAPTVITYAFEDDWKTAFRGTAQALNREEQAEAWLADYETQVQETEQLLGTNAASEISIVRWNPDGPVVMTPESFGGLVVSDVGLTRPEAQQIERWQGHYHSESLSLEQLDLIDGDWLFLSTLNPDGEQAMNDAMGNQLFQQLNAVGNESVSVVDGTVWTSRGGPLAALIVLEDIAEELGES